MNNKIKVLYTIPNFDTAGSGKVVYDLVKGLDKTVFAPEICVFHTRGAFFKDIKKLNVPVHVFKFEAAYRPFATLFFRILKISRFFKKHQFDLIHSWHWSSDITEPLAAKLAGIPFVYTKKAMGWGNRSWMWRSKLSTKVIAINKDMMQEFFKNMPDKVINLPLGVDTDFYKPQDASEVLKQELGLKNDDFVIVSVVNMVPVKGIEILLNAVRQIKDPKLKVLIVGNDASAYASNLKATFTEKEILFLGKKMNVKDYIALANIFVIPTKDEGRKEGMPIAPLEAMAMGVPVLGSNISGIKDVLAAYPEFLFEPSNAEALAKKITEFRAQKTFDKIALVNRINKEFSLKSFISQREKVYKLMLKI